MTGKRFTLAASILCLLLAVSARAEDSIDSLIDTVLGDESFKVRIQAALLLGRSGDERAIDPLITTLDDEEKTVRCAAAIALGNTGSPKAIKPLFEKMDDESGFVAGEAEKALEKIAKPEAIPYLVDVFLSSGFNVKARAKCARMLVKMNDERALAALTNGLGDESYEVKEFCEKAIKSFGPEKEIDFLIQALSNDRLSVRKEGAVKLGKTGSLRAVEALASTLDSPVEADEVKQTAKESLRTLAPLIDVSALKSSIKTSQDKRQRARALMLLGIASGREASDTIISALSDGDVFVRGIAAITLADIRERKALPQLKEMLSDKANHRIFKILKNSIKALSKNVP